MYALVLVVGTLIDRAGRRQALVGGLIVMAASVVPLATVEGVVAFAFLLFALGIGWNLSFVAATAALADRAAVGERGRLLGVNDLGSSLIAAALVLLPAVWLMRPAAPPVERPADV